MPKRRHDDRNAHSTFLNFANPTSGLSSTMRKRRRIESTSYNAHRAAVNFHVAPVHARGPIYNIDVTVSITTDIIPVSPYMLQIIFLSSLVFRSPSF